MPEDFKLIIAIMRLEWDTLHDALRAEHVLLMRGGHRFVGKRGKEGRKGGGKARQHSHFCSLARSTNHNGAQGLI